MYIITATNIPSHTKTTVNNEQKSPLHHEISETQTILFGFEFEWNECGKTTPYLFVTALCEQCKLNILIFHPFPLSFRFYLELSRRVFSSSVLVLLSAALLCIYFWFAPKNLKKKINSLNQISCRIHVNSSSLFNWSFQASKQVSVRGEDLNWTSTQSKREKSTNESLLEEENLSAF